MMLNCMTILWGLCLINLKVKVIAMALITPARDEMTAEEFDRRMSEGLDDAKQSRTIPLNEAFEILVGEINNAEI